MAGLFDDLPAAQADTSSAAPLVSAPAPAAEAVRPGREAVPEPRSPTQGLFSDLPDVAQPQNGEPLKMTVRPERAQAVQRAEPRSSVGSVLEQVPVGFNEGLATVAGAPVDAMTWLLNRIPGVEIRKPFMGSESIKGAMGAIGINPDAKPATTTAERIARGVGGGAALMVAPEAAFAGVSRAGVAIAPRAAETLTSMFGKAESLPAVVANTAVGGAAGGGSAAAAEAAPEGYKPVAELAGGLAGGVVGVGGVVAARGAGTLLHGARDYLAPISESARERIAADVLQKRATSPRAVLDTLNNEPAEILPGSRPTTFQVTGDMGLGALEREVATRNPADFNQLRADQNAVRTNAVQQLQEGGSPADVSSFLRQQLRSIDEATDQAVGRATSQAQEAAHAIGGARPPEAYGEAIRTQLQPGIDTATQAARNSVQELGGAAAPDQYGAAMRGTLAEARAAAKARERELWNAVDPDGALSLPTDGLRQAAQQLQVGMTASARPIAGEERAILDTITVYGQVMPFREITDLRSRISTAMREELRASGETPVYGRLSRLRGAIEGVISDAIEGKVAADAQALARGEIAPQQTVEARINAWVENFRARRGNAVVRADADGVVPRGTASDSGVLRAAGETDLGPSGAPRDPGGSLEGPNFDAAARERLAAATDATRERKQTFDAGPVGNVLRSAGAQGQYRTLDAAVPAQIFRPGAGGFEAVQSFRRAVGDEQASVAILHDYAAASLRRFAERPDGTIDPARYGMWRRQHQDALRALPELGDRFGNAARASETLQAFRPLSPEVSAAHVPENFFHAGIGGFEDVQQLRRLIGDDQTRTILGDYAASRVRQAAMKPDGTIDLGKFTTWRRQHADALRAFPELDARFADAARASEAIAAAASTRKAALDAYQQGAFGRLIGVSEPQDVTRVIGGLFGQKDAVQTLARLAAETSKDPAAREGLRKAIVEHIAARFVSNTEAATSGAGTIKADQFQTFVRQNAASLRKVFSAEEFSTLQAVAADLRRANRSITAVKLPGQSNTAQDQAAEKVSILGKIMRASVDATAAGGTGFVIGGPLGGLVGAIGGGAVTAMRSAGMQKVDDLVKAAMLDPQLARALLAKAPTKPDRGAAMRLAHHIRRVGALALFDGSGVQQVGGSSAAQPPEAQPTGERRAPIRIEKPDDVLRGAERTVEPSPAQAAAGNYRKRHANWKGLLLSIETEVGGERAGLGADGKPWSTTMEHPYGYVKGSRGADGDPLDVYIGPKPYAHRAFVIDQIDPRTGRFDEHKIVVGAGSRDEAQAIYDSGFSDGSGPERRGAITELSVPALKQWISNGDTTMALAYRSKPTASGLDVPIKRVEAGTHFTLQDLLSDPRSAEEIRRDLAV